MRDYLWRRELWIALLLGLLLLFSIVLPLIDDRPLPPPPAQQFPV